MAADAQLGLEILKNMKALKRLDEEEHLRIVREDELIRAKAMLEFETVRFEQQERAKAAERAHELNRLDKLSILSTEQLISVSGVDQGRILAELKRTETLKGMTEEQILALAAEKNPSIAQAFVERYRAVESGKASQREIELYERLLGDQKGIILKYEELAEKRVKDLIEQNKQTADLAKHGMDSTAEVAKAFAENQSKQPIFFSNGQAVNAPNAAGTAGVGAAAAIKNCVNCGRQIEVLARHCPFCGHKFEGV